MDSGAGERRRQDPRRRRLVLALAGAAPGLVLLAIERALLGEWIFPLDDSYIHLVFARSLAAGGGLAFNPGELVAGTTAPLWTALIALLALLPGSILLWVKLAGVALQSGCVLATYAVGERIGLSPRRAGFAALLVAATDWLVFSAPSGMEVPLFTFLSLAGIARHLDERREPALAPLAFLLFALAALARPEGLLLLPLAALDRLLLPAGAAHASGARRQAVGRIFRGAILAALVLVPVGLVFLRISGSIFPTTLIAKSSGPPILVPQIQFLRGVLGLLFTANPWMTLLCLAGALELARRFFAGRGGGRPDAGFLLPLWLLALPIGSAMLSSGNEIAVGNFGRYFFPLLPVIVLLGVVAFDRVSIAALRAAGGWPLAGGALLLLVLPNAIGLVRMTGIYLTACANVRDSDLAAARWLAGRLDPRAVLAVNDIGAIRWVLPNRVLDLVGIVDPPIAARRRAGALANENHEAVLSEIVEERKPDYVVVFPSWYPALARDPARFPMERAIPVRNNVAMAGDMIAVYSTPWTRWPLAATAEAGAATTTAPTAPREKP